MRKRRKPDRPLIIRAASYGGAMALRLCAKATRRPVDCFATLAAVAASLLIIVNAVFLQSGSRPAPYFATAKPMQPPAPPRLDTATIAPQLVAARRSDPIADLIGQSRRIAAVQRVLSDYGYGQIKSSGMLDEATSAAIEKFERERKLPVTGRVSDRLVTELAGMVGHPLE